MSTETITIPKSEYTRLLKDSNSLRKLVSQFIDGVNKLNPAKGGGKKIAPKKLEAEKVSKMTPKQMEAHFRKKLSQK